MTANTEFHFVNIVLAELVSWTRNDLFGILSITVQEMHASWQNGTQRNTDTH